MTGPLSQAARTKLPSIQAVKKQAQRARREENKHPKAPANLEELRLDPADIESLSGKPMLLFDNEDSAARGGLLSLVQTPTASHAPPPSRREAGPVQGDWRPPWSELTVC